jgi:hypothetical protein
VSNDAHALSCGEGFFVNLLEFEHHSKRANEGHLKTVGCFSTDHLRATTVSKTVVALSNCFACASSGQTDYSQDGNFADLCFYCCVAEKTNAVATD